MNDKKNRQLPDLCFTVLPSTGALVCIKNGESGYYPSDYSTSDPARNRETADFMNEKLGVTPLMEKAMVNGSMFGWNSPSADLKTLFKKASEAAKPLDEVIARAQSKSANRESSVSEHPTPDKTR